MTDCVEATCHGVKLGKYTVNKTITNEAGNITVSIEQGKK